MDDQRTDDVTVAATPLAGPTDVSTDAARPWGTVWVWLLAFMPWVVAIGIVMAIVLVFATALSITLAMPEWFWVPLLTVPYLLSVAFAAGDAARLRALGHPSVAPWTWAFLGAPVYLVARSMALDPRIPKRLRPMWVGLLNMTLSTLTTTVLLGVVGTLIVAFLAALAESYANR
ncbi:hypothetical protein K2F54_14760 [Cryobacterium sp. 1639]|uniref:hypothetical protein n=1 Tax=Cryobacterium inferilacus TaxID=2866629 RepID=UPI001C73C057|nr:hypothetical protein [Cryobacterium sp. 1639]MBX0301233.1 hypothetical protein [Cryobacterium sp. 1639]